MAGSAEAPGDKSIAHRWLILAATAEGTSQLDDVPLALDVRSTARALALLSPGAGRSALEGWASNPAAGDEEQGPTTNEPEGRPSRLLLEAQGRAGLSAPSEDLDCGNSGTTMRLLCGVLGSCRFESRLIGDESLSARPMERVAEPLRAMGATVRTKRGRPPVRIAGGELRGIEYRAPIPSAQVKSAVLLAGVHAEGETVVEEPSPTRDHTERALAYLGAPVEIEGGRVRVRAFRHGGFAARVPGDLSSAAFLLAAAALTGGSLRIDGVGLNPTRMRFLDVLRRIGVPTVARVEGESLGEPYGSLTLDPGGSLRGVTVGEDELPLVIDEVPMLALLAAHAAGESRFRAAGELRVKESDRLGGLVGGIRALGGDADVLGNDLVVSGGGLRGGSVSSNGDHRMAMALLVTGLAASGPTSVEGMEAAAITFPGFVRELVRLGAAVEP